MNKTKFISAALLLAAGTAFANAATVLTDVTETYTYKTSSNANYNTTFYGFKLALSSTCLTAQSDSATISKNTSYSLDEIGFSTAKNNDAKGNIYGFLVLNLNDNTVVGKSNTQTSGNNTPLTFKFTGLSENSKLVLDSSTTYRFLTVSADTLNLVTGANGNTYQYSAGTGTVSSETTGNVVSISGESILGSGRGNYAANGQSFDDYGLISNVNGTINATTIPVLTTIKLSSVPSRRRSVCWRAWAHSRSSLPVAAVPAKPRKNSVRTFF